MLQKRTGITGILHSTIGLRSDSGRSVERGLKDQEDFWSRSLKLLPVCLPVSISSGVVFVVVVVVVVVVGVVVVGSGVVVCRWCCCWCRRL